MYVQCDVGNVVNVQVKDEMRENRHFTDHVQVAHDQNVAHDQTILQGLSVPFACIGSSDPVRVLHLYTMNTLDIF